MYGIKTSARSSTRMDGTEMKMKMKMKMKMYFIGCSGCDAHFGGPDGGEYDPSEECFPHGDSDIFEYLLEEAESLGWAKLQFNGEEMSFCNLRCLSQWAANYKLGES